MLSFQLAYKQWDYEKSWLHLAVQKSNINKCERL